MTHWLMGVAGGLIRVSAALAQPGGNHWTAVPSPNAGAGPGGNTLLAVNAISPTDAWAVGFYPNPNSCTTCPTPLAMHWDGAAWSLVSTPALPFTPAFGYDKAQLNAVAAASSADVWAVGWWDDPSCICGRTITMHWNGASWSLVPSPNPGIGNYLNGVAALAGNDVWAVGRQWLDSSTWRPLVMHHDGRDWSVFDQSPHRDGELFSVFALAPNDVWAVGVVGVVSTGISALVLHWDGAAWTRVPFPDEPGGYIVLRGVSGAASNDLWAVGAYKYINFNGHTESSARTFHWDGTSWTRTLSAGIAGRDSRIYGVHAIAGDDVWVVGGGLPPPGSPAAFVYQTVHWDGVRWSNVENPNQAVLYAVSGSSWSDVWAVGFGMDALGYSTGTSTLRYDGPPLCYANCDQSAGTPVLNVQDFVCFMGRFAAWDPYANCDGSTAWPELNVQDFTCFMGRFAAGCP